MKWLKRLNQRPPDDLLLNLFHLAFWVGVVGVILFFVYLDEIKKGY
jgi:hypothetical protein